MKLFLIVIGFVFIEIGWSHQELRPGGAVNMFGRYGYLTISMKVVPRNDSDNEWIFREPIVDVFKRVPTIKSVVGQKNTAIFHGDFNMEFCDNVQQLLHAYFREFKIERLDKPWQAFTGSWSATTLGRNLGLDVNFINNDYCYVLLRLSRYRDTATLSEPFDPADAEIYDSVADQVTLLKDGDVPSVGEFVKNFGSHYVYSYVTGNSLYQVLVYTSTVYSRLKAKLQSAGSSSLESPENLVYFSPSNVEHFGLILPASGNSTVAKWAKSTLTITWPYCCTQKLKYTSLLKLHGNSKLLKEVDHLLQNEAVLHLDLKTLAPIFKDKTKKSWFIEVIDNNFKLWEINLGM